MPPPAPLVTPAAEPKPAAPAAGMLEAPPITPAAPSLPVEPQLPKARAATPPTVELPLPTRPSVGEAAALVARGDALVARGDALVSARDFASARLYYERAAELGDGRGALRMGATFDPAFLARVGIQGTRGDEGEALSWYRRARDLGDAEADRLLRNRELH